MFTIFFALLGFLTEESVRNLSPYRVRIQHSDNGAESFVLTSHQSALVGVQGLS